MKKSGDSFHPPDWLRVAGKDWGRMKLQSKAAITVDSRFRGNDRMCNMSFPRKRESIIVTKSRTGDYNLI